MRIAFVGVGAVGGWFGGQLLTAGHDVAFVARGTSLTTLRDRGLQLNDDPPMPVEVAPSLRELGERDVVFLTVKARGDVDLASLLDGLPEGAPVALTQNAVEMPARVAGIIGRERTWPGVVRGFFHHTGPGRVEFHGGPSSYDFGIQNPGDTALASSLQETLESAGISSTLHPRILVDLWEKAMFVTCFGALGAVSGKPLGHLRTALRASLESLMREVHDVALAEGIPLGDDVVERTLAFADRMPASATSSMQRDLAAGDTGELDAQVGAIVRLGARHGIDTRLHTTMLGVLTP